MTIPAFGQPARQPPPPPAPAVPKPPDTGQEIADLRSLVDVLRERLDHLEHSELYDAQQQMQQSQKQAADNDTEHKDLENLRQEQDKYLAQANVIVADFNAKIAVLGVLITVIAMLITIIVGAFAIFTFKGSKREAGDVAEEAAKKYLEGVRNDLNASLSGLVKEAECARERANKAAESASHDAESASHDAERTRKIVVESGSAQARAQERWSPGKGVQPADAARAREAGDVLESVGNTDFESVFQVGLLKQRGGDDAAALAMLQRAENLAPDHISTARVMYAQAVSHIRLRDDEVLPLLQKLVREYGPKLSSIPELGPILARVRLTLGIVLDNDKKFDAAIEHYKWIVDHFTGVLDSELALLVAMALVNLGDVQLQSGKNEAAHRSYEEVLHRFAKHPDPSVREQVDKARHFLGL